MIFRRTPNGESNTHLFLRVDAVVYVEGGHSLTPDEISAGRYDVYSVDIQFWQRTFGAFFPGRSLDFRAVGAKPTLVSIAEDVIAGRIKNVVVAMDRDHDEFKGRLKSGPNVLYTQGYSWECDVWSPEVTEEVFFALCPVSRAAVGVRAIVDGLFAELKRKLHWLVYADIVLALHESALLPRDKPDAVFQLDAAGRPTLRTKELRNLLRQHRQSRSGAVRAGKKITFDALRNCVGHIITTFSYRVICYLLKQFPGRSRVARQYVEAVAIDKFGQRCVEDRGGTTSAYYTAAFAAVQI